MKRWTIPFLVFPVREMADESSSLRGPTPKSLAILFSVAHYSASNYTEGCDWVAAACWTDLIERENSEGLQREIEGNNLEATGEDP